MSLFLIILFGFGIYRSFDDDLRWMPDGWNLVVADIGVVDEAGVAQANQLGSSLTNGIYNEVKYRASASMIQQIGPITGDYHQRFDRAAEIAERTNASVVIYGIINHTTPNSGTYVPEIYINPKLKDLSLYADEIVGSGQFGLPITFTIRTARSNLNDRITNRVEALGNFLDGVQNYIAEDFVQARLNFQAALGVLGQEGDGQTAAVLHEFLSATELSTKNYNQALVEVNKAHHLWSTYWRPYLTKATILYRRANSELPTDPRKAVVILPKVEVRCFEDRLDNSNTDIGLQLKVALQCYEEALQADTQTTDQDLAAKIALNRANIYLILSM